MNELPPDWPGLSRAERLAGGAALAGFGLALLGLVGLALLGPGRIVLMLFWAGSFLLAGATLGGMLVSRALLPLAGPLKLCALGFLLMAWSALLGSLSPPIIRVVGTGLVAAGLGWGLWLLGGLRR